MATTAIAGKLGDPIFAGVNLLELTKWGFGPEADLVDSTNFTSGGWEENIVGIMSSDIDVEGYYTSRAAVPLTLGALVTVSLGAGSVIFLTGSAIVKTKPIDCEVRGRVGMTCKLRLQGAPSLMK